MIPVRKTVEICDGVKVELLFTPRISAYKETFPPLDSPKEDDSFIQVMESYADIMFFAALNAWELDGHGTVDNFPHKRGDFHGWMSADPKGFADAVKFAVCALTGKSVKELAAQEEKGPQNAQNSPAEEVKKKGCWISRLMSRLKRSS